MSCPKVDPAIDVQWSKIGRRPSSVLTFVDAIIPYHGILSSRASCRLGNLRPSRDCFEHHIDANAHVVEVV